MLFLENFQSLESLKENHSSSVSFTVTHFPPGLFKNCIVSIDWSSVVTLLGAGGGSIIVSLFQTLIWKDHIRGLPQAWFSIFFLSILICLLSQLLCATRRKFETLWNGAYYSKASWTKCLALNPFCSVFLGHVFYFALTKDLWARRCFDAGEILMQIGFGPFPPEEPRLGEDVDCEQRTPICGDSHR